MLKGRLGTSTLSYVIIDFRCFFSEEMMTVEWAKLFAKGTSPKKIIRDLPKDHVIKSKLLEINRLFAIKVVLFGGAHFYQEAWLFALSSFYNQYLVSEVVFFPEVGRFKQFYFGEDKFHLHLHYQYDSEGYQHLSSPQCFPLSFETWPTITNVF